MINLTYQRAKELLEESTNKKIIAVIGDVMLDRYFWGSVTRISPESPVPVVDVEEESFHLGGAANVANNLKSLGIEPILCGVLGKDNSGKTFIKISNKNGINPSGLFVDKTRPTTVKTRIIGNNQHIARLDREIREPISKECENFIVNSLDNLIQLDGIIFEDYNKGTITPALIRKVIRLANSKNIPVFVDPKFDNFFEYMHVKIFKPNKKEAQQALGITFKAIDDIKLSGQELLKRLECENILLTLGRDGMMLFEENGHISSIPTNARHVADVSGAGDTAIATLATVIACGGTVKESAIIANYASGVVCEQPGIVSINIKALLRSIERNSN